MTNNKKGFGYYDSSQEVQGEEGDVNIPAEYIAHPKNLDEYKELEKEISSYHRPEYLSLIHI